MSKIPESILAKIQKPEHAFGELIGIHQDWRTGLTRHIYSELPEYLPQTIPVSREELDRTPLNACAEVYGLVAIVTDITSQWFTMFKSQHTVTVSFVEPIEGSGVCS